ncbi:conjugal transfer protein [Enterobacter cancerogenus]|uniref:Conjugal transfer protein n=2 Tax=Enterobacter cancerogenus TaxID=69218 RepID=A0AB38NYS6_9ENTR|nr:conjugal transfer protein [Enterobacter cancerogenus]
MNRMKDLYTMNGTFYSNIQDILNKSKVNQLSLIKMKRKKQMLKANGLKRHYVLALLMLACSPYALAAGDTGWLDILNQYAKNIQIGVYALAGTVVLICVIISGIRLAISRMSGNHDKTFWDYISDLSMAIWIGGAVVFFTALWQVFGTSS